MKRDQDESSEYLEEKTKGIKKDDSKQKFKRKRTTKKQAKLEEKQQFPCQFCSQTNKKIYLSYSALYLHVQNKHPGEQITSSKNKDFNIRKTPVFKLDSIIDKNQRQETERDLIDLKQELCLKLAKILSERHLIDIFKVGERNTKNSMIQTLYLAERLSNDIKFGESRYEQAKNGFIFKEYFTRIFKISFGWDIVRYFSKNMETSSKLYLSMILLESMDQLLIDKREFAQFQHFIWGQDANIVSTLKEYWWKWKEINKIDLEMDYEQ